MGLKKLFFWGILFSFLLIPALVSAASLTLEPAHGTFVVGSTFEVSIYLNTEGQSVNALDLSIQFPSAKLQMVSPATGNSIIGVWTSQPRFDNQAGTVRLQGGIPGGINVSKGLVATLTFRARGVGGAVVKFGADSKVLANDGRGTDILKQTQNGVYELGLPPPLGPNVASPTHSDQTKWYSNPTVVLNWVPDDQAEGYSYILNDLAIDSPDNISEGSKNSIAYRDLADGRYFFHLKALRDGVWGGVTHFAIKIDTTPPAKFPIEIIPGTRTSRAQPVIQFQTTDNYSGVQRYEIKIVPLQAWPDGSSEESLFVEAKSPHIPPVLGLGSYDVIVRVYDEANNIREQVQRLRIVPVVLRFVSGQGVELRSRFVLPWGLVWILVIFLLVLLVRLALRTRDWHGKIHMAQLARELPEELKSKIGAFKNYRQKYSKLFLIMLLCWGAGQIAFAQEAVGPPIISTVSENISNEEIFYVGGRTDEPSSNIIVYLQNAQTLETQNFSVAADKRGEWFYRHSGFLVPGEYILWAQAKLGETLSPPSPQIKLAVHQTALELGSSRVSYELLYFVLMLMSLIVMAALLAYTIFHWFKGRKKHRAMSREIREAEEALKRGFAVLKRDIEAQLSLVRQAKLGSALSKEEKLKEAQLKKDLEWAEKHAGRELLDIEQLERA